MFSPRRSQNPLRITEDPITGESFIAWNVDKTIDFSAASALARVITFVWFYDTQLKKKF